MQRSTLDFVQVSSNRFPYKVKANLIVKRSFRPNVFLNGSIGHYFSIQLDLLRKDVIFLQYNAPIYFKQLFMV